MQLTLYRPLLVASSDSNAARYSVMNSVKPKKHLNLYFPHFCIESSIYLRIRVRWYLSCFLGLLTFWSELKFVQYLDLCPLWYSEADHGGQILGGISTCARSGSVAIVVYVSQEHNQDRTVSGRKLSVSLAWRQKLQCYCYDYVKFGTHPADAARSSWRLAFVKAERTAEKSNVGITITPIVFGLVAMIPSTARW